MVEKAEDQTEEAGKETEEAAPEAAEAGSEAEKEAGADEAVDQQDTAGDEADALKEEVATLKDRLVRAMAETENVRRRADRSVADASAYSVANFARDMLSVADNLRRALDTLPEGVPDDLKGFVEGVDLTERELLSTLEKHGIQAVKPEVGEKFDHNAHQAMFEVPTDEAPSGTVMQVVAVGYQLKERLLRPAMVGVAKGAPKVDTEA